MIVPQLIYLALVVFALSYHLTMHGKPLTGNYNVFRQMISVSIGLGLLYWGGFFDELIRRLFY